MKTLACLLAALTLATLCSTSPGKPADTSSIRPTPRLNNPILRQKCQMCGEMCHLLDKIGVTPLTPFCQSRTTVLMNFKKRESRVKTQMNLDSQPRTQLTTEPLEREAD